MSVTPVLDKMIKTDNLLKELEDLDDILILNLKEVCGVSLCDANKVSDVFLDMRNNVKRIREEIDVINGST